MARAEKEIDDILAEATANTLGTSPTQCKVPRVAAITRSIPPYLLVAEQI